MPIPEFGPGASVGATGNREDASSDAPKSAVAQAKGRGHHYPALDGVRGVAFLAVFLAHYYTMVVPGSALAWGGWLGVDLFFVLSGFLITGILFDSLEGPRYFRNFYIRRTLRIFPLYYITWIVFLILTPWLHPLWTRFDIGRVFYYGNLMDFVAMRHPEIPYGGFMFHTPSGHLTGFNTGALWSLCLEEQFYLLWPLTLFLVRDRRRMMAVCALGVAGSLVLNTVLIGWAMRTHTDRTFLYNATYAHATPMLCGAWLALWLRGRPAGQPVRPAVYLSVMLVPALVLFGISEWVIGGYSLEHPLIPTLGYVCSGTMFAGVVLAAIQQDGWLKRVCSIRVLTSVGTISYGLYIIQGFLMSAFSHHMPVFERHHVRYLLPVVAFAVTFALASLSYRYYEAPFLRLKDRWAPSRPVSITGRDPLAPARGTDEGEIGTLLRDQQTMFGR